MIEYSMCDFSSGMKTACETAHDDDAVVVASDGRASEPIVDIGGRDAEERLRMLCQLRAMRATENMRLATTGYEMTREEVDDAIARSREARKPHPA